MNNKENELVLYHGSPDKQIVPTYGLMVCLQSD